MSNVDIAALFKTIEERKRETADLKRLVALLIMKQGGLVKVGLRDHLAMAKQNVEIRMVEDVPNRCFEYSIQPAANPPTE